MGLTLYALMDSSFWFNTIHLKGPLYILRGHRLYVPIKIVFLSLKIVFVLAYSVDSDEMPHYAICSIPSGSSLFAKVRTQESTG